MNTAVSFVLAAVLTCATEAPVVYLSLKKDRPKDLISNIILINLITNLSLNLLNFIIRSVIFVLAAELLIPIIEAFMYRYCYPKIPMAKLLIVTYIANAVSLGLGFLLL